MPKKNNVFAHYPWIESKKRYRVRVRIGEQEHAITGKSPDEIDEKYAAMMEAHEAGLVLNRDIALIQYAREWFVTKEPNLTLYSVKMYRNAINTHIAPFFKNMKLTDIKPLNIERFISSKAGFSHSTQSKLLITLNQIMNSAEINGLILKNPCKGVTAGGNKAQPVKPLSKKQQTVLCKTVFNTRAYHYILLCLYAGLRKEEALGLLWSNVHLGEFPHIDVRHAVKFDNDRPIHTNQLKSKAAYRSIPIPPVLADALAEAKKNPKSLFVIYAAQTKSVMSDSAYRRMWEQVQNKTPFRIYAHLLRHTYITELCASGLDIKKIQYLAGHDDVNTTLRIYTHVIDNAPKDLYDAIFKTFGTGSEKIEKVPFKVQ